MPAFFLCWNVIFVQSFCKINLSKKKAKPDPLHKRVCIENGGSSMDTREYRTRTIFKEADNHPLKNGYWPIGLDIGYSSVKVFGPNAVVCFPSYAEENQTDIHIGIGNNQDNNKNITFIGDDGVVWNVGAVAQDSLSVSDTNHGSLAMYGRTRYYDPMFRVLAMVGIAAGLRKNQFGDPTGKKVLLQTGLPPRYITSDTYMILDILKGHHHFKVSFCGGPLEEFDFTLEEADISVTDQPMGTLFSIAMDKNMNLVPDAIKYFTSRVLILDPGFGTFDTFPVIKQSINRDNCQTFDNLGMKQVLKETAEEVLKRYHFEIPVPSMQRYLETGEVIKREGMRTSYVRFDDILEECSRRVCDRALKKIVEIYNPSYEFDYLVITGGTGAAWSNFIRQNEYFMYADTIKLIAGNQGDPSYPYLFSNVRGYYLYLYGRAAAKAPYTA